MEVITDSDYSHAKTVCKDFEISFQSDTLLLTDVFENFRNTFFKISELEPTKFLSARGLAWQAALQRPN